MGNRSKKSAISDINQFTGVGKLFRKISHPRDLGYESFNARPVFCVCKAPPGWRGVKKSRNRRGFECSAIVGIPCDRSSLYGAHIESESSTRGHRGCVTLH